MKKLTVMLLPLFLLAGCDEATTDEAKQFHTESAAIEYGLKKEGLSLNAVISSIKEADETFVFYTNLEEQNIILSVASVYKKDESWIWDDRSQDVQLKDHETGKQVNGVSWEVKSGSGKTYEVYSGISNKPDPVIETKKGVVTPNRDDETGILSFVEVVR